MSYYENEENFKLVEYKAFVKFNFSNHNEDTIFDDLNGTLNNQFNGDDIESKLEQFRGSGSYEDEVRLVGKEFARSKVIKLAYTLLEDTNWIFANDIDITTASLSSQTYITQILEKKNKIRDILIDDNNINMILGDFQNLSGHVETDELKKGQIYYNNKIDGNDNIILYENIFTEDHIVNVGEKRAVLTANTTTYTNAAEYANARNPNTNETSDDRIKFNENIIKGTDAINTIKKINPYIYEKIYNFSSSEVEKLPTQEEWENVKDEWKYRISEGFIAQEIENIPEIKDCVNTRYDGIKTVKYDSVFVHLTSCVKELINKVESLEKEISLLKNN